MQKTGKWILRAAQQEPEDLPAQITEILGKLPQDHALWRGFGEWYCIDVFCGVFMESTNDGLSFPADPLKLLSERGIALHLDVYAPARSTEASVSGTSTPDE